jgi:VPDSG-CTERM motif
MKNIRPIFLGAMCAIALALGSTAKATALTIGDPHELGFVEFGIPSGDADRTIYVNAMIGLALGGSTDVVLSGKHNLVTRSLNDFGPLPAPAVFGLNGTSTTIDLGTNLYSYLFAKYDGPNYGAEVWFVGDLSGTITIPANGGGYGLSGWTLFGPGGGNNTPDSGTAAALLGLGLTGLAGLRARFGRK